MRRDLFPPIDPHATGMLDVGEPHRLYWETSGNANGIPALFLHGGPGAGASPEHRRFFNPERYRIVVFDQRGSGRSTPLGELRDNTTAHLIADIERLRVHLGIERWLVFGGSWGSTLGLAYAEAHPTRCLGLVLRGIFLGRAVEGDWFLHGMRTIFPEAWHRFAEFLPENERSDLLASYYRRLISPEPSVHGPAARSWAAYEGACSTLLSNAAVSAAFTREPTALGLARIEAHYFINRFFLGEGELLAGVQAVEEIPTIIVQGRYDVVCPIRTADDLVRAWPRTDSGPGHLDYLIVPDAGHAASEPGIRAALVGATERFTGSRFAPTTD
jgi:proline iminopeptidase